MHLAAAALITGLLTGVSAHFQLQYPAPRGPFVEDQEPTFCDGYENATANRTAFPLSGGVISFNSEHPAWTFGAILAVGPNPNSFDDFNNTSGGFQQPLPFFQGTGEGVFCANINLNASNITGVAEGANVTLQLIFDGGDGQLYQCADLTLSANATSPTNLNCNNSTGSGDNSTATTSGGNTSPTGNNGGTGGALRTAAMGVSGLAGLVGAGFALLQAF